MNFSGLTVGFKKKKRYWFWNDQTNELHFESSLKEKTQKKRKETTRFWGVNGLTYAALKVNLKFKSTLNDTELMNFRLFLKERNHERTDSVVTIQDCKIVAVFLCIQQLPSLFHKFYDLLSVNQLLRACIVYIQFYLQTCETIVKTQHYLRGGFLPSKKTSPYQAMKEDLEDLRILIGRFYAGIIFAEFTSSVISRTEEIMLFECFLKVSTIVVWIALERKYFDVIKVELERIFRTDYFTSSTRNQVAHNILDSIKDENHLILQGKVAEVDKGKKNRIISSLTSNSPIIHNFLLMNEPMLIRIERKHFEEIRDARLKFLIKYIFMPETEIQQEGVCIGILGLHRRLFDPLLYPRFKRILKLLITGSPMDISEDRKKLREYAIKKAQKKHEPQSPHIFDELPKIPRPNQLAEEVIEEHLDGQEVDVEISDNEEEGEGNEGEEEYDESEECEEENWTELEN